MQESEWFGPIHDMASTRDIPFQGRIWPKRQGPAATFDLYQKETSLPFFHIQR